ncbi:MAG: hypothetical protein Q7T82_14055 [Armatimonadota bacterium]|nr:hypothetical protein [Armatimonadota bacterium]
MNLSKLRRLHVIIIGSVACVVFGVGLYFLLIRPVDLQIAQVSSELASSQAVGSRLMSSRQGLEEAISKVDLVQTKLARYETSKMPNLSFAERDKGMIQLWHEQSEMLGPILERWARRGVQSNSTITLPAPPTNPNQMETNLIRITVGKIEVVGNFRSILQHIRSWNTCPRLVQIDRPSLSGTSPALTATYDLTVYIFPRTAAGPEIKMAGAGGATGATAGMPPAMAPTAPTAPPAPPPPPTGAGGGNEGTGGMGRRGMGT